MNAGPNPFAGAITLNFEGEPTENITIRIYDLTGRILEQQDNRHPGTEITAGANLANGMYILEAVNGAQSKKIKIVKMN